MVEVFGNIEMDRDKDVKMSNIEKTKHKIAVMQAYVDGKVIEILRGANWVPCKEPGWVWRVRHYRIAEESDGWISHDGKSIPVAHDVAVIRKYRDGLIGDCLTNSGAATFSVGWLHSGAGHDIVAYKLAGENK